MKQLTITQELSSKLNVIASLLLFYLMIDSIFLGTHTNCVFYYLYNDPIHGLENAIWWLMAIFGIFIAQASLLALWADRSLWKSYIRVPLACLGVIGICCCLSEHLDMKSPPIRTADYFYLFGVHFLLVLLLLFAVRVGMAIFEGKRNEIDSEKRKRVQFSIGTVLIWTTIIAFLLGWGKMFMREPVSTLISSTPVDRRPTNLLVGFFLGTACFNALFALLSFTAILGRKRIGRSFLIVLILAQPFSWLEACLINCENTPFGFFNNPYGLQIGFMYMANAQILTIYATLLPLRWCGLLGGNRKEGIDPPIPKADAIANESA